MLRREESEIHKDRLLLKDGTEIVLDAGASLGALQLTCESREEMMATWGKAAGGLGGGGGSPELGN